MCAESPRAKRNKCFPFNAPAFLQCACITCVFLLEQEFMELELNREILISKHQFEVN